MLPTLAEILALMELNRNSPANRRKSGIRLHFPVTRQNTLQYELFFFFLLEATVQSSRCILYGKGVNLKRYCMKYFHN